MEAPQSSRSWPEQIGGDPCAQPLELSQIHPSVIVSKSQALSDSEQSSNESSRSASTESQVETSHDTHENQDGVPQLEIIRSPAFAEPLKIEPYGSIDSVARLSHVQDCQPYYMSPFSFGQDPAHSSFANLHTMGQNGYGILDYSQLVYPPAYEPSEQTYYSHGSFYQPTRSAALSLNHAGSSWQSQGETKPMVGSLSYSLPPTPPQQSPANIGLGSVAQSLPQYRFADAPAPWHAYDAQTQLAAAGLTALQHAVPSFTGASASLPTLNEALSLSSKTSIEALQSTVDYVASAAIAGSRECASCGSHEGALWHRDTNGNYICARCSGQDQAQYAQKGRKPNNDSKRQGLVCINCHTSSTTLWRRDNNGEPVCNACGLYYKLHQINRPISMKKEGIQTRKRKPKGEGKPRRRRTMPKSVTPPVEIAVEARTITSNPYAVHHAADMMMGEMYQGMQGPSNEPILAPLNPIMVNGHEATWPGSALYSVMYHQGSIAQLTPPENSPAIQLQTNHMGSYISSLELGNQGEFESKFSFPQSSSTLELKPEFGNNIYSSALSSAPTAGAMLTPKSEPVSHSC